MAAALGEKGLLQRPLDLLFFIYFAVHIPTTLLVDLQAFYPSSWVPDALKQCLEWYVATYKDPFMGSTTPVYWFNSFIACELVAQLPVFILSCYGLLKNCLSIRLIMLGYSAHVATTVVPLLAEILLNPAFDLTRDERVTLSGFYAPYLLIPLVMLVDSYRHVAPHLVSATRAKTE